MQKDSRVRIQDFEQALGLVALFLNDPRLRSASNPLRLNLAPPES